jgi:dTDP-glucose pyrophosphorylase
MNTAIILSAGQPKNSNFSGVHDSMIPINGVPVINHIINSLSIQKIGFFIVVLNYKDKESAHYLEFLRKKHNIAIKIVTSKFNKGPGNSLLLALKHVPESTKKIIINLGDTIILNQKKLEGTYLVVKDELPETKIDTWAYFDKGEILDKPSSLPNSCKVVCGFYQLDNVAFLNKIAGSLNNHEKLEISNVLNKYYENNSPRLISEKDNWMDLGHDELYHKAKVKLMKLRFFNSLIYDSFNGTITKKSSNITKLKQELDWYVNIPQPVKIFAPRLVKSSKNSYTIEYYNYSSLSDILLFGRLELHQWNSVLNKLLDFLKFLGSVKKVKLTKKDYQDIFVTKTENRISLLIKDFDEEIINFEEIIINNATYKNPLKFINDKFLKKLADRIYLKGIKSIIHGDMCFSNILYDLNSNIFKIIDPRGKFGNSVIGGEQYYDLAKLRHSISGDYDYIVSDLFILTQNKNRFEKGVLKNNFELKQLFDNKLKKKGYNLEIIKNIEMLLFLSMIPLHKDSKSRQKMMYLRFVELYWEIYK